jgi:hypothetical protein
MTRSQKKQLRRQFSKHRYPVKTFQGDPTRPAYTLYSLWEYPTYLAAANELDELLEQWPRNQARTVALLAVRTAFFDNGAPYWDVEAVHAQDQENIHSLMLWERRWRRRIDPKQDVQYNRNSALAEAALVESQRRKQSPSTGKVPRGVVWLSRPKPVHISRSVRYQLLCNGTKGRKDSCPNQLSFLPFVQAVV